VLQTILPERLSTRTQLLANYPNPFNTENRIPFLRLSQDMDLTVTIYMTCRETDTATTAKLATVGRYVAADRATYWNGESETGEAVASGTYFDQLKAGETEVVMGSVGLFG